MHRGVFEQHRLMLFELLPADIPRMRVADERGPFLTRQLVVPPRGRALPRAPVDKRPRRSAGGAAPRACVDGRAAPRSPHLCGRRARFARGRGPIEASRRLEPAEPNDLVFGNRKGEPFRESKMLTRVLQPAAESAGLGRVTRHQFRHIHSSLLNDLRVPAKIAQEQLGHASIRRR
jgi:hypothetical protein